MNGQQLPKHLDLTVGQKKSFECPNAGVSGYAWQAKIEGSPGIISVAIQRGPAKSGKQLPIGAATPEALTIQALKTGDATIHLSLARPWEKGAAPIQSQKIAVRVK